MVSVPSATELAAIVVSKDKLPEPSNAPEVPVTSPVKVILLPVAHFVAVSALPIKFAASMSPKVPEYTSEVLLD